MLTLGFQTKCLPSFWINFKPERLFLKKIQKFLTFCDVKAKVVALGITEISGIFSSFKFFLCHFSSIRAVKL